MFIPNTTALLSAFAKRDLYGEPVFEKARLVECAVVSFDAGAQKTSVRTDSSASRGNAEETVAAAKILFPVTTKVRAGDKLELHGVTLLLKTVQPRLDVAGRLDHYECVFAYWPEGA